MNQKLLEECCVELIGTFALGFVGIRASKHNPDLLSVALPHGLPSTGAAMTPALGAIFGLLSRLLGGDRAGLVYGRWSSRNPNNLSRKKSGTFIAI